MALHWTNSLFGFVCACNSRIVLPATIKTQTYTCKHTHTAEPRLIRLKSYQQDEWAWIKWVAGCFGALIYSFLAKRYLKRDMSTQLLLLCAKVYASYASELGYIRFKCWAWVSKQIPSRKTISFTHTYKLKY